MWITSYLDRLCITIIVIYVVKISLKNMKKLPLQQSEEIMSVAH